MQENGLVPIVEPEVTLGPGDYGIEETAFWSAPQFKQTADIAHGLDRPMQQTRC